MGCLKHPSFGEFLFLPNFWIFSPILITMITNTIKLKMDSDLLQINSYFTSYRSTVFNGTLGRKPNFMFIFDNGIPKSEVIKLC